MTYSVEFTAQAEKDILRLDKSIARDIANKIDWLSQNIESVTPVPLKGKFKDKYKLRAGDWQIIYSLEHPSRVITFFQGYART